MEPGAWPAAAIAAFALLLVVSGALVVERKHRRPVA
jgi:hypothetical protein